MALSERLQYILDFNTQGGIKALQDLGSTAEQELGKVEDRLDKLGGNLTKFGAGAVAFAGVAGAGLAKLAGGAAEAGAATAALRQVVDEVSANKIEDWARNSAEAVGLASKEAVSAATGFAGLGKIIDLSGPDLAGFSTQLVQMAADMAAFKDVSPQQALADLQSLFAGSTEVGRKYNIFLDDATLKQAYFRETGERVTGTLTAQQRIIATNSELFRQGADMIGQWGRESGELAGQQAQLRANLINLGDAIGQGALPMLTQLVGAANKAAQAFSKLDPSVQSAIGKFGAMAVAGAGLVGTLSLVAGQVIKMRDRFTALDQATGTRSLNNFGKAAVGVGAALGVASAALAVYTVHQQKAAQNNQEMIEGFQELSRVADAQVLDTFTEALANGYLAGKDLDEILRELATTNIEGARRLLDVGEKSGWTAEQIAALEKAITQAEAEQRQLAETNEKFGDSAEGVAGAIDGQADALGGLTDAYKEAKRAAESLSNADRQALQERTQWLEEWNEQARRTFELNQQRDAAGIEAAQRFRQAINDSFSGAAQSIFQFSQDSQSSFEKWKEELAANIWRATEFRNHLIAIGQETSPAFVQALAEMGVGALEMVEQMRATEGGVQEAFDLWSKGAQTMSSDIASELERGLPGAATAGSKAFQEAMGNEVKAARSQVSRDGDAIGADFTRSLAGGIDANTGLVTAQVRALAGQLQAEMRASLGLSGGGGGGSTGRASAQ